MKRCFVLLIILLTFTLGFSTQRERSEIFRLAREHYHAKVFSPVPGLSYGDLMDITVVDSSYSYYVVNIDDNFVLVSSDNRLPTVLGYGDSPFNVEDIPPALSSLLTQYDNELRYLDSMNQDLSYDDYSYASFSDEQSPLLTTRWGQRIPYNNYAPFYNFTTRCATGCVATAMAQLMYYWKYPKNGVGSSSYYWYYYKDSANYNSTLKANYGNTTYDWVNMLPSYDASYTPTQAQAVATLMYHCGVAVEMLYGPSSGAYSNDIGPALQNYFSYDPNYQQIQKDYYNIDSLAIIVHDEIKNGRPVIVSGSNAQGAHTFICDGYDIDGYFHVNWGWNGISDGYYLLSAFTPSQQGTGGTNYGYNSNTRFIIGLQPNSTTSAPPHPQITIDSLRISDSCISREGRFDVKLHRFSNIGLHDFSGSVYISVTDEDNNILFRLSDKRRINLSPNYYYLSVNFTGLVIPTDLPNGSYRLYAMYDDGNYDEIKTLNRNALDNYLTLYITDENICVVPNMDPPDLSIESLISFEDDERIPRGGSPLNFIIKNNGGRFIGQLSARIYQGSIAKGEFQNIIPFVLARGETIDTSLINVFASNLSINTTYTMRLCYRNSINTSWETFNPSEYNNISFRIFGYNSRITDNVCYGLPYKDNGFDIPLSDIPEAGKTKQYTKTVPVDDTRDSVVLLTLTTIPPLTTNLYASVCEGYPFTFLGQTFYEASTEIPYEIRSHQEGSCDSIYYLYLTVIPPGEKIIRTAICEGETYNFFGTEYDKSTLQDPVSVRRKVSENCDSIYTLYLTVAQSIDSNIYATIRRGSVYYFMNVGYTESTMDNPVAIHKENPGRCDSVYYLYLDVLDPIDSTIHDIICSGNVYTFKGNDYAYKGENSPYDIERRSINFFQPDTIFHLYLHRETPKEKEIYAQICQGESYNFRGVAYSRSSLDNPFVINVPQVDACDSVYKLYLTVKPAVDSMVTVSIHKGERYFFHGNYYYSDESTTKAFTIRVENKEAGECDTIFSLYLNVLSFYDSTITASVCHGGKFIFRGVAYSQTTHGNPYKIVVPASSPQVCDTNFYLYVNLISYKITTIRQSICEGETFTFRGVTYSDDIGDEAYVINVPQEDDCDSLYYLYLSVNKAYQESINANICLGEEYEFKGVKYRKPNPSGEPYIISLSRPNACDSTFYLFLRVDTPKVHSVNVTLCPGEYYEFNGVKYDTPKSDPYVVKMSGKGACDETYFLYITQLQADTVNVTVYLDPDEKLPYYVDENFSISERFLSDTTIYVNVMHNNECTTYAYFIDVEGNHSAIPYTDIDIVRIEIVDMLGRNVYSINQTDLNRIPPDLGSYFLTSALEYLNLTIKTIIIRYIYSDGSYIVVKNEIR